MMSIESNFEPKIYVACLAAYNNGILFGDWIDANQDADQINESIQAMLKKSPITNAEEWAIHDFEDFGGIKLNESEDIENVAAIAAFLVEHGELGAEVLNYSGNDIEDAEKLIEEGYQGHFDSEEEFATQLYQECYEIPPHLEFYIDYKAVARDLFINDYFSLDGKSGVHVFRYY